MSKMTKELHFEDNVTQALQDSGWTSIPHDQWNVDTALFEKEVIAYLDRTQAQLMAEMRALHREQCEAKIIEALGKELNLKGTLHVLRRGFKFYGKTFFIARFRPAHSLNEQVIEEYQANRLLVCRQARLYPNSNDTLDILFALNGIPVATCEVKNPFTGQTFQDAIKQYKNRKTGSLLFAFKKRALVHFAADPDEVWMTTRLEGDKTFFLPFNRGSHPGEIICGAGNPCVENGYKTDYFWREILHVDGFMEILAKYMFVETKEKRIDDGKGAKEIRKVETVIFPRFHQLEAVRQLIRTTLNEGIGQRYLIQHSAGSGKTNSISWLSHQLSSLHNEADEKMFHSVIVISDRKVLDSQLQSAVYQIQQEQGVVKKIDKHSKQLVDALIDGASIVVTTLQKFPEVIKGLLAAAGAESLEKADSIHHAKALAWSKKIAGRRYAVIIDEAHSSQSGEAAKELKAILGVTGKDYEELDVQDLITLAMESNHYQPNLSIYAFTATPKGKTLTLFGRIGASGKPEPFHRYSMRQAIEEGFILDVLKNYTTYKTFFEIAKKIEDDPSLPKKKGAQALMKFMTLHPHNISQKTEIMVEHFRLCIRHLLSRKSKAMVVTESRIQAVRYKKAFDRYIKEHKYDDIRSLIAFSGEVIDPDDNQKYTEVGMNKKSTGESISEAQLKDRFDSPDFQILLVANKYQTGFDQPLLTAMYVDKRLDGVQAVQTLSRLNRCAPGKSDVYVLDFRNEAEDIQTAFAPFYDTTLLEKDVDPDILERLKHQLDETQIYHQKELDDFAEVFYVPIIQQRSRDHQKLNALVDPAKERFKELQSRSEEEADRFRDSLKSFVRLYSYLSQILPYMDTDFEKLSSFGRFLLKKLPYEGNITPVYLNDEVELRNYRNDRIFSGAIKLGEIQKGVNAPHDVGTGGHKQDETPLSTLIEQLNDRFGTEFKEEDRLFFEQIVSAAKSDENIIQTAEANTFDHFMKWIEPALKSIVISRLEKNDAIVSRYLDDDDFYAISFQTLAWAIYNAIRKGVIQTPN